MVNREEQVTSVRQAAAVCNVTPRVVWRWLFLGLIPGPPWTLQQLHNVRDMTDPQGRRRGPQVAHGTMTRWNEGCSFTRCRQAQNNAARVRGQPDRRRSMTAVAPRLVSRRLQRPGPAAACIFAAQRATPAGVPAHEPASSRKRLPSHAAICCGESARTRAAASSNASGMPSSARQIRSTGPPSLHPPPNTPLSTQGGQKLNTWAGVAEARLAIKIAWPSL